MGLPLHPQLGQGLKGRPHQTLRIPALLGKSLSAVDVAASLILAYPQWRRLGCHSAAGPGDMPLSERRQSG